MKYLIIFFMLVTLRIGANELENLCEMKEVPDSKLFISPQNRLYFLNSGHYYEILKFSHHHFCPCYDFENDQAILTD